jgi:hypothetical protein
MLLSIADDYELLATLPVDVWRKLRSPRGSAG